MKALINNIKSKLNKKFHEIGHRRPHIFDVLVGMFLFWILTILFSTSTVSCTAVPKVIDGALLLIDNEEENAEKAQEIIEREKDKETL